MAKSIWTSKRLSIGTVGTILTGYRFARDHKVCPAPELTARLFGVYYAERDRQGSQLPQSQNGFSKQVLSRKNSFVKNPNYGKGVKLVLESPFLPKPYWLSGTVVDLVNGMKRIEHYEYGAGTEYERIGDRTEYEPDEQKMGLLGDALQDAGCDSQSVLDICYKRSGDIPPLGEELERLNGQSYGDRSQEERSRLSQLWTEYRRSLVPWYTTRMNYKSLLVVLDGRLPEVK